MERRYLVAALAIIATFAVFSRGLRSLEQVSLSYGHRVEAKAQAKCNADASATKVWVSKVRTHLRPGYAEEAQMLAEMNLPLAMVQAKVAQQVAQQNAATARCARALALREAERAQRQAEKMRETMERAQRDGSALPIAWEANLTEDVNQRIQAQAAALADRISAQDIRIQMAADRWQQASDASDADVTVANADASDSGGQARCNRSQSWEQTAQAIRARSRTMVREIERAFASR